MSKVKVQGHATATGILTIAAPNTNSDRTITLPDATGTLLTADGDGSSLSGAGPSTINDLSDATVSASDPAVSTNPSATGHVWINKTSGAFYVCTDISTGDNAWVNVGAKSGNIS